jgi:hypothetical protein
MQQLSVSAVQPVLEYVVVDAQRRGPALLQKLWSAVLVDDVAPLP